MFQLKNGMLRAKTLAACLALPAALAAGTATAGSVDIGKNYSFKDGSHLYEKVCGRCHDFGIGPVITGRQLPPEYITAIVRNGFRAMPAFPASYIDDKTLQSVGEYIQKSAAPAAAKP